ncbi:unnamed protein product [Cyprideis torosa]|uniref:Trans-1,2-dihydrobenzene-1,2-diol dehydrogenase n=1 Tax=Cyprideis torosa TaxID=163714 RepID=A0A7R8ZTW1_9CRUS|nr:unnamed protein product [Cyprideis torosa]CAG0899032.1 unnamed protein product [Cyprideis torosa]
MSSMRDHQSSKPLTFPSNMPPDSRMGPSSLPASVKVLVGGPSNGDVDSGPGVSIAAYSHTTTTSVTSTSGAGTSGVSGVLTQQFLNSQQLPLPGRWEKPKEVIDSKTIHGDQEKRLMAQYGMLLSQQLKLSTDLSAAAVHLNAARSRLRELDIETTWRKQQAGFLQQLQDSMELTRVFWSGIQFRRIRRTFISGRSLPSKKEVFVIKIHSVPLGSYIFHQNEDNVSVKEYNHGPDSRAMPVHHKVVAVAARDRRRAEDFAESIRDRPVVHENYDALCADPHVEVIYVGSIHPTHFKIAMAAMENGKHVLVEKPMAMNVSETEALISKAKEKNVFLMEAIWSRCHPGYRVIKRKLDEKSIGEVLRVEANFGQECEHVERLVKKELGGSKHVLVEKPMAMNVSETEALISKAKEKNVFLMEAIWSRCHPGYRVIKRKLDEKSIGEVLRVEANFGQECEHVERLVKKALGGSSVLDLGIYTLQLALMVFGGPPQEMWVQGCLTKPPPDGVDAATNVILSFDKEGRKSAVLKTDVRLKMENDAYIYGTKGRVKIHAPFHTPCKIEINGEVFDFSAELEGYRYDNSYFFRYEAEEVRECLLRGAKESELITLQETLTLARIMEGIRKKVGMSIE